MSMKNKNLEAISNKTVMQYMRTVTKRVELKIREVPDRFAIYLDGWSQINPHITIVFTVFYPKFNPDCYDTALLTFSPLLTGSTLSSKEHQELLEYTLQA